MGLGTYNYLDFVPKGRDEDDRYESGHLADPDRPYWPADAPSTKTRAMGGQLINEESALRLVWRSAFVAN